MSNKNNHLRCPDERSDCEKNLSLFRTYCAIAEGHFKLSVTCTPITVCGSGRAFRVTQIGSNRWMISVNMWMSSDSIRYYTAVAFAEAYLKEKKGIKPDEYRFDSRFDFLIEEVESLMHN